ncbi:MAG: threonine/serine exporter family protein [Actinomycetota bacterium]|nr:threonine/serine exporter family protein [Actinomycetota bacterium]
MDDLVDHPVHQTIDRRSARQRIAEISSAAKPYPRWLVSVASGLVAAGMAILLRGNLLEIVVAFVTTVLLDQALRQLARRRIPGFYQQIAGALLATSVTLVLRALDVPVRPSIIIAASIVVLLAGVTIVGAVQDALTGYYVTASARTFEAALLTGGVIAGVSLGLTVGVRFGGGDGGHHPHRVCCRRPAGVVGRRHLGVGRLRTQLLCPAWGAAAGRPGRTDRTCGLRADRRR